MSLDLIFFFKNRKNIKQKIIQESTKDFDKKKRSQKHVRNKIELLHLSLEMLKIKAIFFHYYCVQKKNSKSDHSISILQL